MPQGELMLKSDLPNGGRNTEVRQCVAPITNGKLNGDQITFTAAGRNTVAESSATLSKAAAGKRRDQQMNSSARHRLGHVTD